MTPKQNILNAGITAVGAVDLAVCVRFTDLNDLSDAVNSQRMIFNKLVVIENSGCCMTFAADNVG